MSRDGYGRDTDSLLRNSLECSNIGIIFFFFSCKNHGIWQEKRTGRTHTHGSHHYRHILDARTLSNLISQTLSRDYRALLFPPNSSFSPTSTSFSQSLAIQPGAFHPKPSWLLLSRASHYSLAYQVLI